VGTIHRDKREFVKLMSLGSDF